MSTAFRIQIWYRRPHNAEPVHLKYRFKLDDSSLPIGGDEDGGGSLGGHELVAAFFLCQFAGVLVNVDVGHPFAEFLLPVRNKRRRNHDQKVFRLLRVDQRTYKRRHLRKYFQ